MAKYLVLYRGDITPPPEMPEHEHDAMMVRWGAWLEEHGAHVDDPGFPFAARTAIDGDGNEQEAVNLSGYSMVEGESIESVREICRDHPFLHDAGPAHTVEIYELLPI